MVGEKEEDGAVFSLLLHFLRLLNREELSEDYVRIFEIRLLTLLGYQPQLDRCLVCHGELEPDTLNWFNLKKGGVVCPTCHAGLDGLPISLGTSRILKAARSYPLSKIRRIRFTAQASDESRRILSNFVEYQLGKKLKCLRFLEQMKGA